MEKISNCCGARVEGLNTDNIGRCSECGEGCGVDIVSSHCVKHNKSICKECQKDGLWDFGVPEDEGKNIKLVRALQKDFKSLYTKGFTTSWKTQRWIRNIELGVMRLENTEKLLEKAKREGEYIAYNDIVETILADDDTDILKYAQDERAKLSNLSEQKK